MFDRIIAYSVRNKFVIALLVLALIIKGIYSLRHLPIDALPDITNNQVQVITLSPTLATQEIERFITTPIELALRSLQNVEEIRSVSRFGLSVITVVFEEDFDVYLARQLIEERLKEAEESIPEGLGKPVMAPLSTGLGEIYQYVVHPRPGYEDRFSAMDLRQIQDWVVKPQLLGIPGVAEVNSFGGKLKQYEVAINPARLKSMNISIGDVLEALERSNENTGGAYIEKNSRAYYIRSEGLVEDLDDIGEIVVMPASWRKAGPPVLIKDIATVRFGEAPRYGALVRNGEEVVGGKVMMLKGANSAMVTEKVKERVAQINKTLPEGTIVEPFLVRDKLIKTTISTVKKNLLEGGLIVIFILVLLLGNWRAGLIVASVIPLAMLFAITMMYQLGISANLMSLGAIDFGLIVDGAVIIVESIVHQMHLKFAGQKLSQKAMDDQVIDSSQKIRSSAAFGEIIIMMVYIPILALVGIEGKMFKPMAQTVMLAIGGALILSLTYVPMMSALFLKKKIVHKETLSDKIMYRIKKMYMPVLNFAMRFKKSVVIATLVLFLGSLFVLSRMGGEFIPTLEEGDLAMQHILPPGSSLSQSIRTARLIQERLLSEFPEITDVVANIGSAEIPTDPMPVEIADYVLVMKPKSEWTSAKTRKEMFEKIEKSLSVIPGVAYEFSQPVQLRFNELITGSKADIAIKLFGDDLDLLSEYSAKAAKIISKVEGVGTVNVEQTIGMPQIVIRYNYNKLAQYGLHVKEVNRIIRTAFAGEKTGVVFEGERRFDLVARLEGISRQSIEDVKSLYLTLPTGAQVPLSSVADIVLAAAPAQISREDTHRRVTIGVNVGNTDVESLVEKIRQSFDAQLNLPVGYYFEYGGQFEHLETAKKRLGISLIAALTLVMVLLYFTLKSFWQAILIFVAIPLSAIGGIWALYLRGMPFSISAGIGFIALFGVAVLNGIVLISFFNRLKREGMHDLNQRIFEGTGIRLRPVVMTAAVASLGFLPMALSTSGGAEVQRPLATVVVGGLISATILTLVILPVLYYWLEKGQEYLRKKRAGGGSLMILLLILIPLFAQAQTPAVSLEEALATVLAQHPEVKIAGLQAGSSALLSNLPYDPGSTEISFQGDGMFVPNPERVHQLGISQELQNPAKLKAQKSLFEKIHERDLLSKEVVAASLRYVVREAYSNLQYQKELASFYRQMRDTYAFFLKQAEAKFSAGVNNRTEVLALRSKRDEFSLLHDQKVISVRGLEQKMGLLLGRKLPVTTKDSLAPIQFLTQEDVLTPALARSKLMAEVESAKANALKKQAQPDFQIGYSAQRYFDNTVLSGIEAGIVVKLFNGNRKKKIMAQKMNVEIAQARYEQEWLSLHQQLALARSEIDLYKKGMDFYRSQVEKTNPELVKLARLNYQSGQVSYLELLQVLQTASQNQKKYLDQLAEYNRAVVRYLLLTNQ